MKTLWDLFIWIFIQNINPFISTEKNHTGNGKDVTAQIHLVTWMGWTQTSPTENQNTGAELIMTLS